MVQIDIPASFIAGMFFVDVGRKALKNSIEKNEEKCNGVKTAMYYKFLFRSVLFAGAVIAPAGIFLLAGWPGWEQLYWTDRVEHVIFSLNAILPTMFVIAIVLGGYFGHVLGYRLLTTGRENYIRPIYMLVLIGVAAIVLYNSPAFLLVGTYEQYHNNREAMIPAWKNPYNFTIAWVMVMFYFAINFIVFLFKTLKDNWNSENA